MLAHRLLRTGFALCCLGSCNDYQTGQLDEPQGPLVVTKLTLSDSASRGGTAFTDTSLPDCSKTEAKELPVCKNDAFMDRYAPHRSPPTLDPEMRVIFNKVPLHLSGRPLSSKDGLLSEADRAAIELVCEGCQGMPVLQKGLDVTGSGVSFDPTVVPYGPALFLRIGKDDPKAALEPDTPYRVQLAAQLSGRDQVPLRMDAEASRLLAFRTEPFRVLQVGLGDDEADAFVYGESTIGTGAADKPYQVEGLAVDGVLALRVNAPLQEKSLAMVQLSADVDGRSVPLRLGYLRIQRSSGKITSCDARRFRFVYLVPELGVFGGPMDKTVQIRLPKDTLQAVSQAMGHPVSKHSLGEITLRATLSGKTVAENPDYKGLRSSDVSTRGMECP